MPVVLFEVNNIVTAVTKLLYQILSMIVEHRGVNVLKWWPRANRNISHWFSPLLG